MEQEPKLTPEQEELELSRQQATKTAELRASMWDLGNKDNVPPTKPMEVLHDEAIGEDIERKEQ
jgi:hypothetical protein